MLSYYYTTAVLPGAWLYFLPVSCTYVPVYLAIAGTQEHFRFGYACIWLELEASPLSSALKVAGAFFNARAFCLGDGGYFID